MAIWPAAQIDVGEKCGQAVHSVKESAQGPVLSVAERDAIARLSVRQPRLV